jgi:hypothetical protein
MPRASARSIPLNPRGVWPGLSDASAQEPTLGFARLSGCYHGRDGTELRRWPGSRVAARPFCGQAYGIAAATGDSGGVVIEVTTPWPSHYAIDGAQYVHIAGNEDIPDGSYLAIRESDLELRLPTLLDLPGTLATNGHIWIKRLAVAHALVSAEGRPVVVAETAVWVDEGTEVRRNVGCWVGSKLLDPDDPEGPGFPAASGDDEGFQLYRSPTMLQFSAVEGEANIWGMDVRGRIAADMLNGRVCLAVPGHGHLWQADVTKSQAPRRYPEDPDVPDHRVTRCLGIPQGILQAAMDLPGIYEDGFVEGTIIWVAIGYRDPLTGEVGLPSRTVRWRAGAQMPGHALYALRLQVHSPRSVLLETHGLEVVVYAAHGDEDEEPPLEPVHVTWRNPIPGVFGNRPNARPPEDDLPRIFPLDLIVLSEEETPKTPVAPGFVPLFELMPTGASIARVVKARLWSGGDIGTSRDDVVPTTVRTAHGTGPLGEDERYVAHADAAAAGSTFKDARAARYRMPSGYGGHELSLQDVDNALLQARMAFKTNPVVALHRDAWVYEADVPNTPEVEKPAWLHLQPHVLSYTEEAVTSASPGINRVPIDRIAGRRPWGLGRLGDQAVLCTDREAHLLAWGAHPRQVATVTISNDHGCIAPASMVECPAGLVWLSHDGPVGMSGGGVQWLGREIRSLWETFLRGVDGLMWFAQGWYDPVRQIVCWSLRGPDDVSGAWEAAQSAPFAAPRKVPGDLVLAWHYPTGGFSLVRMDGGREVVSSAAMPVRGGTVQACVMHGPSDTASDTPIYLLDDDAADRVDEPTTFVAEVARTAGDSSFRGGSTLDSPLAPGDEAFVRSADGRTLRWWGAIAAKFADGYELHGADGATWQAGDVLVGRVIHMGFTTHRMRLRPDDGLAIAAGVTLRFDLRGATHAYARVLVIDQDERMVSMTAGTWGERLAGSSATFARGKLSAQEVAVEVDVIADGAVSLKSADLDVEVVER